MDAGIAAILGAAVGLVGVVAVEAVRSSREKRIQKEQAQRDRQRELLVHYVDLLSATRELRYIALRTFQNLATRPIGEVDGVLTKMSRAYYLIAITASSATSEIAWTLREDSFEMWRPARDEPRSEKSVWLGNIRKVRADSETFRHHVRHELAIAPDEVEEPTESELMAVSKEVKP